MKVLATVLACGALTLAWAPAQAATHRHVHYVHVVHHHFHHHYHYYAGGARYYGGGVSYYPPPPGYYPAPGPYYAPGVYAPGYFYATPEEPLGNRGTLKALIDSEWDPPFSGR
jgi:hypothetical protein